MSRATRHIAARLRISAAWYVRSSNGTMAPFSAFSSHNWTQAPSTLQRFNGVSSYEIQGQAAAGHSSGAAMDEIEKLAHQIPGIGTAWSRPFLSGAAVDGAGALSLCAVDPGDLPVPCRALRELVDPDLGAAGDPARRDRRGAGGDGARARQRHLFPGRPAHHDRAVGQERDPDRRVRRIRRGAGQDAPSRQRWRPRACAFARS